MSVHIYATNGHHNVRVGYTDRWGAEVLGFIDGVARDNEQVLFLGEYGASPCPNKWTPSTPFVYASNVLDALVEHSVPLSAIWVFDCDIRCNRTRTTTTSGLCRSALLDFSPARTRPSSRSNCRLSVH